MSEASAVDNTLKRFNINALSEYQQLLVQGLLDEALIAIQTANTQELERLTQKAEEVGVKPLENGIDLVTCFARMLNSQSIVVPKFDS